ncbi:MAG: hypothetical protein AUJ98_11890 [Bacteroidetes bacterium CG2_30_33_31]|nr:MAG: hypothetical protein AUJ98_11890 [Bacteroidetes bacterium CG2_30_33_31]
MYNDATTRKGSFGSDSVVFGKGQKNQHQNIPLRSSTCISTIIITLASQFFNHLGLKKGY